MTNGPLIPAQTAGTDEGARSGLQDHPLEHVRTAAATFGGQEVCLFVTYVPEGRLLPGALAMVRALVASGLMVVVCCAVDDLSRRIDIADLEGATRVVKRRNGGYDFAAWAALLAAMPELWSAKRLFFVNDSILGPLDGFDRMLDRIRASSADFLALTESSEIRPHSQSYFFVLQNKGLSSDALRQFWQDVRVEKTKMDVIEKYETELLRHVRDGAGLDAEILFSLDFLFPGIDVSEIRKHNPTHYFWEHLIRSGFPFVKAELLYANPMAITIDHWAAIVALHGGDVDLFREHVAKLRETRGAPDRRLRHERWKVLRRMLGDTRFFELCSLWGRIRGPHR